MSQTPDDDERDLAESEEHVRAHRELQPMTAAQAATGLASEIRDEMELRHVDERTFGYLTEEFERERTERHTAELAALEIRERGAQQSMTIESIARDPWSAVQLKLPEEITAELAGCIVDTCYELRNEAAANVYHGRDPDGRWRDLRDQADARWEEALVKLDMARAREAWQAPEFSRATIAADAWTAVYLPIPEKADAALLQHARGWAEDLARYAEAEGPFSQPLVNPGRHGWEEYIEAARARVAELDAGLERAAQAAEKVREAGTVWAAWQQPAFSFETIKADPWTAVYLPLPEDANRLLLTRAYSAASVCRDMIEDRRHGPRVPQGNDGPDENLAQAHGRMAELEPRILAPINQNNPDERMRLVSPAEFFERTQGPAEAGQTAEPLTVEAIARDHWNAVRLEIPQDAGRELLQRAREAAAHCVDEIKDYIQYDQESFDDGAFEELGAAGAVVAVLDARLKMSARGREDADMQAKVTDGSALSDEAATALTAAEDGTTLLNEPWRETQAVIEASVPERNFLSGWFIAREVSEHLARAVDMVLEAFFGFFVDEPKLTPQQIHDTLQSRGNVEAAHDREVAALTAGNEAAHEYRMMLGKGAQQEKDLYLGMVLGTNATAEANLGLDGNEQVRERQRGRHF